MAPRPRRLCLSPFQGLQPTVRNSVLLSLPLRITLCLLGLRLALPLAAVRNSVLLSLPLRITLCSLGLHVTFAFGEQPTGLTLGYGPRAANP